MRIAQPAAASGHLHPNMVAGGQYNIFAAHLAELCECVMSTGLLLCPGLLASKSHWPDTELEATDVDPGKYTPFELSATHHSGIPTAKTAKDATGTNGNAWQRPAPIL